MEEEDHDVITNQHVGGQAQYFELEELESRTTPFQEGENDVHMPSLVQVTPQ